MTSGPLAFAADAGYARCHHDDCPVRGRPRSSRAAFTPYMQVGRVRQRDIKARVLVSSLVAI